jgi:hypothetical protein
MHKKSAYPPCKYLQKNAQFLARRCSLTKKRKKKIPIMDRAKAYSSCSSQLEETLNKKFLFSIFITSLSHLRNNQLAK